MCVKDIFVPLTISIDHNQTCRALVIDFPCYIALEIVSVTIIKACVRFVLDSNANGRFAGPYSRTLSLHCNDNPCIGSLYTYVDDDAEFAQIFDLGTEQFPDSLLLVALTLVELVVVGDDVGPVTLQGERRLVVVWSTTRQTVRHLGQTVQRVVRQ